MLRTFVRLVLASTLFTSAFVPVGISGASVGVTARASRTGAAYDTMKPAGPAGFARPDAQPEALNVQWRDGVPAAQIAGAAKRLGFKLTRRSRHGWTQVTPPDGVSVQELGGRLRRMGLAEKAAPAKLLQAASTLPNDPSFAAQWSLHNTGQTSVEGKPGTPDADIDAPEAWDITRGSKSVVVAVVDTGVDWRHADLRANIWTNPGEIPNNYVDDDFNGYEDDAHGFDFYNYDGSVYDPEDGDQHGTHVAGTIGAASNNSTGIAGVAWDVTIMPLKFLGPWGGDDFAGAEAIYYAVDNGADIINCSWGGYGTSELLEEAIAYADDAGVLICAAAGNASADVDVEPFFPACSDSPNVITVAATDRDDKLADFSNYGANTVDIGAPGVEITSTLPWEDSALFVNAPPYKIAYLPFQAEALEPANQRDAMIVRAVAKVGATPAGKVLVVDDSAAAVTGETPGERLAVYTGALAGAGYTQVSTWVTESQGAPTASAMRGKTVVWFTGKTAWGWYEDPIMTDAEMDSVGRYLDDGGRLVMVSGELATDAEYFGNGWEWFETYFRCTLVDILTWSDTFRGKAGTSFSGLRASLPGSYSVFDATNKLWPTGSDAVTSMGDPAVTTLVQVGGYGQLSGTSMAAPHVSGAAALLKAANPAADADELVARLTNTGDPVAALEGKTVFERRLNVASGLGTFLGRPTIVEPQTGDRWQAGTTRTVKLTVPSKALQSGSHAVQYGVAYEAWSDGFEDGDLDGWSTYETTGTAGWTPTGDPALVHSGSFAARSGALGPGIDLGDGWTECSQSSLLTTVTVPEGGGTLSFWYKYDGNDSTWLDVWLDGRELVFDWEDTDWRKVSAEVPAGEHLLVASAVNCSLSSQPASIGVALDEVSLTAHAFSDLTTMGPGAREATFSVPALDTDDLWLRVRGTDGTRTTSWSYVRGIAVSTDLAAPAAPTALTVTSAGDGLADASWINPADIDFDSTRVLWRTDRMPTGPSDRVANVASEGTATAATIGPVAHGRTVYVAAYATDLAGNWSAPATATVTIVDTTAPDPVELLDGGLYDGVVTLSWMAPDPDRYQSITVLRRTDATPTVGDPEAEVVFNGRGAMAEDWTLEPPAARAYYTVFARDASGNKSEPRSVVVELDLQGPTGKVLVAGGESHVNTTTVDVTCAVDGATHMRLFANGEVDDDAEWLPFATHSTVKLLSIDGVQAVTGQFRDAAGNESEMGDDVYVDLLAPAPPEGLGAESWNTGVMVSWDKPADPTVTAIRVFHSASPGGPWISANGPKGSPCPSDAFYIGGLRAGVERYVAVSAIDRFGREGDRSEPLEVIPGDGLVRFADADRYATAVQVSKGHFGVADTVILVSGLAPADALGAAALAGCLDSPVLLTRPDRLPQVTLDEIVRLGASKVVVIGGQRSVSPRVVETLTASGIAVERIAGANRYATAAATAQKVVRLTGAEWDGTVLVANGYAVTDALAAGPLAYSSRTPVLLAAPTGLPADTAAFVSRNPKLDFALALGGMRSLPEPVVIGVSQNWRRLGGANRYATARTIAEYTVASGNGTWETVGLASGLAEADALAAGPALGSRRGVLLLTGPVALAPEASRVVSDHAREIGRVEVFGGKSTLPSEVVRQVQQLLRASSGEMP